MLPVYGDSASSVYPQVREDIQNDPLCFFFSNTSRMYVKSNKGGEDAEELKPKWGSDPHVPVTLC